MRADNAGCVGDRQILDHDVIALMLITAADVVRLLGEIIVKLRKSIRVPCGFARATSRTTHHAHLLLVHAVLDENDLR